MLRSIMQFSHVFRHGEMEGTVTEQQEQQQLIMQEHPHLPGLTLATVSTGNGQVHEHAYTCKCTCCSAVRLCPALLGSFSLSAASD